MATLNTSFTIAGASTGITFTPTSPEPPVPVAPGTVVGAVSVQPAGWTGALTLGGTDSSWLAISGTNVVVGSVPLSSARTYSFSLIATP